VKNDKKMKKEKLINQFKKSKGFWKNMKSKMGKCI
jgi:hypothetical protein